MWAEPLGIILGLVPMAACACGGSSDVASADQVEFLTDFLDESAEAIGLEPSDGQRRVEDLACPDIGGDTATIELRFDEPSRERAVMLLTDLQQYWEERDDVAVAEGYPPADEQILATVEDLPTTASWGASAESLFIEASTECNQ